MKYPSALFRQIPALALYSLGLLGLASCSGERSLPPCPNIFALADAKQADHFRPGTTHGLDNIEYAVRLDSWTGSCGYKPREKDWDVSVDLTVNFTAKRGPAATGGDVTYTYFVAIPAFYPKASAKQVIPVSVHFDEGQTSQQVQSGPVTIILPVRADDAIDTYTIYLGLQLQPDELSRNRKGP